MFRDYWSVFIAVEVHVRGDLVVRARLQHEQHGLSTLFSLKLEIFALLHVKAALLVANNPQRIWSHFSGISAIMKNKCYTEVIRASKSLLLNFNTSFIKTKNKRIKRSEIERSIEFDCAAFLCEFDFRLIEFDWVRSWLTMPGGNIITTHTNTR